MAASPFSLRQAGICAFVFLHLYTATVMAWPFPDSVEGEKLLLGSQTTMNVLDWLGIWHRLRLFAPVPPRFTGRLLFELEDRDGRKRLWQHSRDLLSLGDPPRSFDRYVFYYIVWSAEVKNEVLWPEFARYVARRSGCNGKVRFIERYTRILPPELGIGQPPPELDRELLLLEYDVASDRFQLGERIAVW